MSWQNNNDEEIWSIVAATEQSRTLARGPAGYGAGEGGEVRSGGGALLDPYDPRPYDKAAAKGGPQGSQGPTPPPAGDAPLCICNLPASQLTSNTQRNPNRCAAPLATPSRPPRPTQQDPRRTEALRPACVLPAPAGPSSSAPRARTTPPCAPSSSGRTRPRRPAPAGSTAPRPRPQRAAASRTPAAMRAPAARSRRGPACTARRRCPALGPATSAREACVLRGMQHCSACAQRDADLPCL